MNEHDNEDPLLPYYVYVLLDPRISVQQNERPFYVGKGSGRRVQQHKNNTIGINEISDSNSDDSKSPKIGKTQRIVDIQNAKFEPLEVIVGRYETEAEAFAVEAILIHFMFGLNNLTNEIGGHGSNLIRSREEFEKIIASARCQKDIPQKSGVDIETIKGTRNNDFRNAKIRGLAEAGAYQLLADLQQALTDHHFSWRDFRSQEDSRFHPGESNGYLAVIVRIGSIDFNIQFTKTKYFSIQLIYTESSRNTQAKIQMNCILDKFKLTLSEPKANNKYSWIEPRADCRNINDIIKLLKKFSGVCATS